MSVKFVNFNYSDSLEDNCDVNNEEYVDEDLENDNIKLNIEDNHENNSDKNNQTKKTPRFQHKRQPNEVTYDDILNSLGFGFNNGVLHRKETTEPQQYHQPNYHNQQTQLLKQPKMKTLDPAVKNSAIYNKYFKNYKDPNYVQEPQIPLTPEQLKIKLIHDYIERVKAKRRIALIKPKKMLYSTQNVGFSGARQNPSNLNKFFSFSNK
jgi:hypothetical protein